jgi:Ca2+-binding RTX toxin-like protein
MMRKRSALVGACAAVAVLGVSAQTASAGLIRVDTSSGGVKRLLFSEGRDPVTGLVVPEANQVRIIFDASGFVVVDDGPTPITAGAGCTQQGAEAHCDPSGITLLRFPLGGLEDTFDNQTATPASVTGGTGSDTILNSGGGDDAVDVSGTEADTIESCGDGNDTVTTDRRDTVRPNAGCETVNGVGPGGGSGDPGASTPPPSQLPVTQAPPGTAAPVSAGALVVPPTAKQGACRVPFIGTIAADRIDGSADGDIEYGQAGDDYMNGQAGDDCLYGLDGDDRMLGDDGLDLVVGGNGKDAGYGGNGNDRLYGVAGADRLYGDSGNDRLSGGLGNDRLRGSAGNDQLYGGPGNDEIDGGPGNDTVSGGAGRDHVVTEAGADHINVRDRARDTVNCGPGRDSVTADKVDVLRNCERVTRR